MKALIVGVSMKSVGNMRIIIMSFLVILLTFLTIPGISQPEPFTLTERTEQGIGFDRVWINIEDKISKDQTINITNIFVEHSLTEKIGYQKILLNQSVEVNDYDWTDVTLGKYKTLEDLGNGTIVYYDGEGQPMSCDYVLPDKSCMKSEYIVIGTHTQYEFLPLPELKEKITLGDKKLGDKKIEYKQIGIPLPKDGKVQLYFEVTHPIVFGDVIPESLKKYDIKVSSKEGEVILDPAWANSSYGYRKLINVSNSDNVAHIDEVIRYNLSADTDIEGRAYANFSDVRFVRDTTEIPVNITQLDYVANKTQYFAFFLMTDTIDATDGYNDTLYYIYYDCDECIYYPTYSIGTMPFYYEDYFDADEGLWSQSYGTSETLTIASGMLRIVESAAWSFAGMDGYYWDNSTSFYIQNGTGTYVGTSPSNQVGAPYGFGLQAAYDTNQYVLNANAGDYNTTYDPAANTQYNYSSNVTTPADIIVMYLWVSGEPIKLRSPSHTTGLCAASNDLDGTPDQFEFGVYEGTGGLDYVLISTGNNGLYADSPLNYTMGAEGTPPVTPYVVWDDNSTNITSGSVYSKGAIYAFGLNVTDTGDTIDKVELEFDGTNYSATNTTQFVWNATLMDLRVGNTYTFLWYMNLSSGETNKTDSWSYIITKLNQSVYLAINGTENENVSLIQPQSTNVSGWLGYVQNESFANLTSNGTQVATGSPAEYIATLDAGIYNLTYYYPYSENLTTNSTEIIYLYITTGNYLENISEQISPTDLLLSKGEDLVETLNILTLADLYDTIADTISTLIDTFTMTDLKEAKVDAQTTMLESITISQVYTSIVDAIVSFVESILMTIFSSGEATYAIPYQNLTVHPDNATSYTGHCQFNITWNCTYIDMSFLEINDTTTGTLTNYTMNNESYEFYLRLDEWCYVDRAWHWKIWGNETREGQWNSTPRGIYWVTGATAVGTSGGPGGPTVTTTTTTSTTTTTLPEEEKPTYLLTGYALFDQWNQDFMSWESTSYIVNKFLEGARIIGTTIFKELPLAGFTVFLTIVAIFFIFSYKEEEKRQKRKRKWRRELKRGEE